MSPLETIELDALNDKEIFMTDSALDRPDAAVDHPNVMVFPPVILLSTLVLACALQWPVPGHRWAASQATNIITAVV